MAAPHVEVAGVHWERIQLVITIGAPTGTTLPTLPISRLFLSHVEDRRDQLEPRQDHEPSERLRFNLFAGADRMPISPGRWQLMYQTGAGHDVPVTCDASVVDMGGVDREFVHPMWTIRITPVSVANRLEIRFSVRPTPGRPGVLLAWRWHRLLRSVRQRAFRAAVALIRLLPRGRRLVVFTSDSRAELGGNLGLVHDRMVERSLDRRVRLQTILKGSVRARRRMVDRGRLAWLLARADVILVDDYQPALTLLPPHPRVRIVQLWHAWGAFKTVGYSRIGKPGGPNPYSRVHKNYTYATVGSEHEVPFYSEAFGLPESSVVATGTPRMDEFLNPDNQDASRRRALDAIPAARGRRVILFAPTFRGDGARQASYPTEIVDMAAFHALATEIDAVVVLKLHPFVPDRFEIPSRLTDRLIDVSGSSIDVNDVLLIADVLITDYSSLVFEYSALGKPMLFFAFDLDDYVASRDFYEPFEAFAPGPIVGSFPELLAAIRSDCFDLDRVDRFARTHLPSAPGSATDRIIDQLILAS